MIFTKSTIAKVCGSAIIAVSIFAQTLHNIMIYWGYIKGFSILYRGFWFWFLKVKAIVIKTI